MHRFANLKWSFWFYNYDNVSVILSIRSVAQMQKLYCTLLYLFVCVCVLTCKCWLLLHAINQSESSYARALAYAAPIFARLPEWEERKREERRGKRNEKWEKEEVVEVQWNSRWCGFAALAVFGNRELSASSDDINEHFACRCIEYTSCRSPLNYRP